LRLDRPSGPAAAVNAGVAAARGKIIIAWEAAGRVSPRYLPRLLDRLIRADFVAARTEKSRFRRFLARLRVFPRRLLLGAPTLDPDGPCWAACREAVADLALAAGQHRYLPWIVSMQGYRVGAASVPEAPAVDHVDRATRRKLARWSNESGGWFDLLALWWKRVRAQEYCVDEIQPTGDRLLGAAPRPGRMVRFDPAHPAAATTGSPQKSHYDDPPRS
ncbi:MAG TPA: glycosyltransferase, partial [Pirellulales bacterium]